MTELNEFNDQMHEGSHSQKPDWNPPRDWNPSHDWNPAHDWNPPHDANPLNLLSLSSSAEHHAYSHLHTTDSTNHANTLESIGRKTNHIENALEGLADTNPNLSKIEKECLKSLQTAILSGDVTKLAEIVKGFGNSPESMDKIAKALKDNLESTGDPKINVSWGMVDLNGEGSHRPHYVPELRISTQTNGTSEASISIYPTLDRPLPSATTAKAVSEAISSSLASKYPPDYRIKHDGVLEIQPIYRPSHPSGK